MAEEKRPFSWLPPSLPDRAAILWQATLENASPLFNDRGSGYTSSLRRAGNWATASGMTFKNISETMRSIHCIMTVFPRVEARWLTVDVTDLAVAILGDKAFDRLPILSDALMDAGCDSEKIISHLRSGEHVCSFVERLVDASK